MPTAYALQKRSGAIEPEALMPIEAEQPGGYGGWEVAKAQAQGAGGALYVAKLAALFHRITICVLSQNGDRAS